jgi:hypothetical protein
MADQEQIAATLTASIADHMTRSAPDADIPKVLVALYHEVLKALQASQPEPYAGLMQYYRDQARTSKTQE